MTVLKKCPFCGSEPTVTYMPDGSVYIGCTNKKCFAPVRYTVSNATDNIVSGLNLLWNTRPIEDALQVKLDIAVVEINSALSYISASDDDTYRGKSILEVLLAKLEGGEDE